MHEIFRGHRKLVNADDKHSELISRPSSMPMGIMLKFISHFDDIYVGER